MVERVDGEVCFEGAKDFEGGKERGGGREEGESGICHDLFCSRWCGEVVVGLV